MYNTHILQIFNENKLLWVFPIKLSTCEFPILVNIQLNFDKYPTALQFNINSLKRLAIFPFILLHFWPNCYEPHFVSFQMKSQSFQLVKQFRMSSLKAVFYKDRIRPAAGTTFATQKYNSLFIIACLYCIYSQLKSSGTI